MLRYTGKRPIAIFDPREIVDVSYQVKRGNAELGFDLLLEMPIVVVSLPAEIAQTGQRGHCTIILGTGQAETLVLRLQQMIERANELTARITAEEDEQKKRHDIV